MRPLRLELKGFTAFREAQEIDFEGLDLFAISGPTGSGKTSILDAITYALFGYIDRVGKQAGQFISQGQPRMAVSFDFAVDGEPWRVTRSTPARGASSILVQRWDGEWRQAGEGADRVRDANAMLERAIGLDYDAFTRTVLLPQGRFAEFLVGDAKERRAILTDLLGLELFERLGRRAGDLKREADAQARAKTTLLETEYADVSPDAVANAEALAKEAAERDAALAEAEAEVRRVAERWADSERSIGELRTCERDLRGAAAVAAGVADALEGLVERSSEVQAELRDRARAETAAGKAAAKAAAAREKAEAAWGRAVELAGLRAKAEALLDVREALAEAEAELAEATGALPALAGARDAAAEATAAQVTRAEAAMEALATAEAALEEARHADLVAAVRAGVRPGQACPVCGKKVGTLPKAGRAVSLGRAQAAMERARADAEAARDGLAEAQRAEHGSASALAAAESEAARCEKAAAKLGKDASRLASELGRAMGGKVPTDPVATLDERLARLDELELAERGAQDVLAEARDAVAAAERERDALAARVAEERARLGSIAAAGLLDRAGSLVEAVGEVPPPPTGTEDAAALASVAGATAALLEEAASALEEVATQRSAGERAFVREAAERLEGLVDVRATTVAEVVEAAAVARTGAAREAATAEDRAARTREQLANAQAIEGQVTEHRERAQVFDALAKELRQDRLIAFLQLEALQLLAAAGSERLAALSQGRYRLEFEEDEFSVVDTWNGEERRSARTLSGGETFLASLALALALSEQVRSLAVTEKARLDSLFLDEGFGTLDPESLEVVVEAIEQLGGDGRTVGVITHVQELAIRLPARIEVEKSPRGSRLRLVR
ncbi:MAG TPA: SMC family ATPase [Actinomycetota bacterium]